MKKSPLYYKSGMGRTSEGSPVKLWSAGVKIAKKIIGPALVGGATYDVATDKTEDRSTGEKILRAIDEWGPTLGLGSWFYDNTKDKETPKWYEEGRKKKISSGYDFGTKY